MCGDGQAGADSDFAGSVERNTTVAKRLVGGSAAVDAGCGLGSWAVGSSWLIRSNDVAVVTTRESASTEPKGEDDCGRPVFGIRQTDLSD